MELKHLVSFAFTVQYDPSASQDKMKYKVAHYCAFNRELKH